MRDIFNKKIGMFVSGLFRNCDNIDMLFNFIYPMSPPIHFYLSTENNGIYRTIARKNPISTIMVDNSVHPFDKNKVKWLPPSKPEMIPNTIEMFYKKKNLLKFVDRYDIIIQMRPDLVSLNGKLIDLIYQMYQTYDDNTLYTTKLYSSVGITD